jgi:dUTP pyrophosphatase
MTDLPKYEVGDRIGQIKIGYTSPIEFVEIKELTDTERGAGGFGSTGK